MGRDLSALFCIACYEPLGTERVVVELETGGDLESLSGAVWHLRCGDMVYKPELRPDPERSFEAVAAWLESAEVRCTACGRFYRLGDVVVGGRCVWHESTRPDDPVMPADPHACPDNAFVYVRKERTA